MTAQNTHNKFSLKKIFNIWNILWGIIGGIAVLVGLIVGYYSLYDRFSPESVIPPNIKEYIFGTNYYYVQVLTDDLNKILAYGVTTREKDFNPSLTILEGIYYADKNDPMDGSKYKLGSQVVILGKTRFSDLGMPVDIFAHLGAHDFYYHEEYYYGNPGNYQSYFFAANNSGYLNVDYNNLSFFDREKIEPNNAEVASFRNNSEINTFYITAPGEGWDNAILRKYLVGPDYYQVRVIPKSSVSNVLDKNIEYDKLSKLSVNVDIANIIALLGKPLMVNNKSTFDIRTDKTINQRFNEERK